MNIVFIKDKLNSIDSVLPILFECYKKYNQKSLVVVSDKMAYTGIQENIVIRDAINYFGSVVYLGKGFHNKVIRRMFVILKIINFIIRGINGAKFIHFGHLDLFPYKILGHLFKKNVYLVTATPFEHYFEDTCLNGIPSEAGRKNIYNMAKPIGKNFIYFNKNSLIGLEKYKDKLKIYDINRVKMRKDWVSFVFNKLPEYMYNQHPTVEKNDKVITFMLGGFFAHIVPGVVDSKTQHRLFEDVIEVLDSCCDYKVLLKPHVYTDVEYVKEMLSKYSNKFEITYLHPTLLAIRSNIFICINYSSTMADGHSFGVTTIEYSKYIPEELIATENRSAGYPFVDYFIQNDIALLRKVVSSVCGEVKKDIDYFKCENEDPSRLIYDLSH